MRICSIRSSTLKFVFVLVLSAVALSTLVIAVPSAADTAVSSKAQYASVQTNEERIAFISGFGWTVDSEPVSESPLDIPEEFDDVYKKYNEIQKQQGFDLSKYRGEQAVKYTYNVTNFKDYAGKVSVSIIVCKNKIIGGDICSADSSDFIYGLTGEKI